MLILMLQHKSVIPESGIQRKEDYEFEASLDHIARVYSKTKKKL